MEEGAKDFNLKEMKEGKKNLDLNLDSNWSGLDVVDSSEWIASKSVDVKIAPPEKLKQISIEVNFFADGGT